MSKRYIFEETISGRYVGDQQVKYKAGVVYSLSDDMEKILTRTHGEKYWKLAETEDIVKKSQKALKKATTKAKVTNRSVKKGA